MAIQCNSLVTTINIFCHAEPSQPRNEQAAPTKEVSPQQPSSPLVQFTSYLKAVYERQKFPNYGKWPPWSSKKYINLACIEKDKERFVEFTIRGNVDDIVSDRHPMNFQQIAKVGDGSWPKLILVEGAPGVGKSTFAWKVCRKWNKGTILNQYKLVILLRLRDKHVREAKTLYDLIYYHDPEEWKLIVKEILKSNGKEALLLFEGYDELPAQLQRDEESILLKVISGNCLPEATVLVTSRHSASGLLLEKYKKRISQHIEILGFTKENVQTYINENVRDSEESKGLERYLSYYPHIRTMMYIPLNSVIVVEVYHQCHDKDKPAPKTMTELYTSLVRTLLIRYLMDKGKQEIMIESFGTLKTYGVYEQFCKVCKTAYDGIDNNQQVIFYKTDIPGGFETLDLLQEVHELYVDKGDCVSYNFLHLTIQEYLAAVHLSMQPMDVQIQHFKDKGAESSFEMVLRFLSGLTKFHNYPQQDLALILEPQGYRYGQSRLNFHWLFEAQNVEYISSVLKKDEFSVDRLSTSFEAYALGYCVAHSNLRWILSESKQDSSKSEMLIRGVQAEETQCKGILYGVNIEIDKDPLQFYKPGTLSKFFDEITCRITSISFLTTELKKDLTLCTNTLKVVVKYNEMKVEHSKILSDLIRTSTSLRHFTMDIQSLSDEESASLCSFLEPIVTSLGQNTSLESVSFPNNGLFLLASLVALMRTGRSELYPRVLQLLNARFDDNNEELFLGPGERYPNTTAKHLSPAKLCSLFSDKIPLIYIGDTSFLSDLINLQKLVVKGCEISGNNIKNCITEAFLVHCKGIESKASDEEVRSLVDVEDGIRTEQSNKTCTLEHIELTSCIIEHVGTQYLAQALCENTSVKTLKLNHIPLHDEGAKALAEILFARSGTEGSGTVNSTLEHVDLSWCNILPVGTKHLSQALYANTSIKTLNLSGNHVDDEGAQALAEMLGGNGAESSETFNTTLEHVDLSQCSIGPEGVQHLARALCVNASIKTLVLNVNHLYDEGAKELAEMLGKIGAVSSRSNTTLEHVYLNSCNIGHVGAKLLAESLRVNTSVKTLKLSGNPLREGASALARMLGGNKAKISGTVNTTLEHVDLSNCDIGPVEVQHLAQALCVNTSVKTLILSHNPIQYGVKALAGMLGKKSGITVNTTLEHLDLSSCDIGPVEVQHLAQALCFNTSLKTLKLRGTPLAVKGAKALADMLRGNGTESSGTLSTTLELLDLCKCSMEPIGAQHLADACVKASVEIILKTKETRM